MKLKSLLSGIMFTFIFGLAAAAVSAGTLSSSSSNANFANQTGVTTYHYKTRSAANDSLTAARAEGYTARMYYNSARRQWAVEVNYKKAGNLNSGGRSATGAGCEAALRSGATVLYFPSRQMAEEMYNAHLRQGDCAKVWNAGSQGWALAIKAMLRSNGGRRGQIATRPAATTPRRTTSTGTNSSGTNGGNAIGAGCENALKSAEVLYFPSQSMANDIYKAHLRQGDCAKIWNAGSRGWAVAVKAIPGAGSRPNRRSRSSVIVPGKTEPNRIFVAGGINAIRKRSGGAIRPSRMGATRPGGVS